MGAQGDGLGENRGAGFKLFKRLGASFCNGAAGLAWGRVAGPAVPFEASANIIGRFFVSARYSFKLLKFKVFLRAQSRFELDEGAAAAMRGR